LVVTAALLAAAWARSTSLQSFVLIALVEIPILIMFGICGLGTWRWFTLSYALAPTTLEIRYGTGRVRIRYQEVSGVAHAEWSEARAPSLLWPGAPAGEERLVTGRVAAWWGTTTRRANRVVVDSSAGALVLTPAKPMEFCEALWANATASMPSHVPSQWRQGGWLDQVASMDGWFRVLTVLAFELAAAGIVSEIVAVGRIGRPSTVATIALLLNAGIGFLTLRRAPGVARVVMGATIALQCLGLLR
jgi:hypothetical protein